MHDLQNIADAVQKGLLLILRASVQQGRNRQTHLRTELYSDSFHTVLALKCGPAKCQCCMNSMAKAFLHMTLRVLQGKIAGFSPLLSSREEKGAIFKLRKKRGFERCSNISFPLIGNNAK